MGARGPDLAESGLCPLFRRSRRDPRLSGTRAASGGDRRRADLEAVGLGARPGLASTAAEDECDRVADRDAVEMR